MLKWKIRAMAYDVADFLEITIGRFLESVFGIIRGIIYAVLCVVYKIGMICFIMSFYIFYKCYEAYKQGISYEQDLKIAILMFVLPLVVAMLKEVVKPKYYK